MIELRHISKSFKVARRASGLASAFKALFSREYATVQALDDISFTIQPGEIVGYIGPNGAGKSTTIKIMCGILVPDSGECRIMGCTPWQDRASYVRHIGVLFGQRTQLWWDVPVMDSFEMLRDIYRVPRQEYRRSLEQLTETLELDGLLRTPVRQLSLGQRMRCEIAASLLHNPDILFLDEPTIGLDAMSKQAVRQFIRTINRERGVTVILTTHDMQDIEALADRIIMIGKGRLLVDGKLSELRSRFGSHKTITIDYRAPRSRTTAVRMMPELPGTQVLSMDEERAILLVDTERTNLSEVLGAVSSHLEVVDVSITGQPIEEIVLSLYKEHEL